MVHAGRLRRLFASGVLVLLLFSVGPAGPQWACSERSYAEAFHQALAAARADRWEAVDQAERCLGQAHPLAPYLEFHRLRAELPELNPRHIEAFRALYADSPLTEVLTRVALRRYAEAGDQEAIRRVQDAPPGRVDLRCQWWYAQLEPRPQETLEAARELWHVEHSQPPACDSLFDAARSRGAIGDDAIWQRSRLAYRAGNERLMDYLRGLLEGAEYREAADQLKRLYRSPGELGEWEFEGLRSAELTADALYRLAAKDTEAALEAWHQYKDRMEPLSTAQTDAVADRISWYSVIRGLTENLQWVDTRLLEGESSSTGLLEQRARLAVVEQSWAEALFWIGQMPPSARESARWQYWLGRSRAEMGDLPGARRAWRMAAQSRSFWGFVAADRLGLDYALRATELPAAPPDPEAGLLRVKQLRAAGELRLARDEWLFLLRGRSSAELRGLAAHAAHAGWYELAVDAARRADADGALRWRFPPAYEETFRSVGAAKDLDPYLLMALARRESGFNPRARSGAGARGLMQLLPGTAREQAERFGMPLASTESLWDPDTNALLGAAYLRRLLDRFDGNRPIALAAYNAGPSRVAQWLEAPEKPFDVWIESIPFHETRSYVQAVMAYQTILEHLYHPTKTPQVLDGVETASYYGGGGVQPRWPLTRGEASYGEDPLP